MCSSWLTSKYYYCELSRQSKRGSIILKRGQPLRQRYQDLNADKIPLRRKLRWLRQAAEGYRHAHEKDIVNADIGCYNILLTRAYGPTILMGSDCLKLIDFGGASIDGGEPGSHYTIAMV